MNTKSQYRNAILTSLSAADRSLIDPHLEPVQLGLRQRLENPKRPISHIYFPEIGIVSIVIKSVNGRETEVGLIGWEGFTGLSAVLGVDRASTHEVYVQAAGAGNRISVDNLRTLYRESQTLQASLLVYAHIFIAQVTGTAAANCHGKIEERLARWLLMARDRLMVDELPLTHEFLSMMLGVHRPGVTIALSLLQQKGLLLVKRGHVEVIDRSGLEKLATRYYGAPEAEQRRLFDQAPTRGEKKT